MRAPRTPAGQDRGRPIPPGRATRSSRAGARSLPPEARSAGADGRTACAPDFPQAHGAWRRPVDGLRRYRVRRRVPPPVSPSPLPPGRVLPPPPQSHAGRRRALHPSAAAAPPAPPRPASAAPPSPRPDPRCVPPAAGCPPPARPAGRRSPRPLPPAVGAGPRVPRKPCAEPLPRCSRGIPGHAGGRCSRRRPRHASVVRPIPKARAQGGFNDGPHPGDNLAGDRPRTSRSQQSSCRDSRSRRHSWLPRPSGPNSDVPSHPSKEAHSRAHLRRGRASPSMLVSQWHARTTCRHGTGMASPACNGTSRSIQSSEISPGELGAAVQ
jgi:hypothetical protein